MDALGIYEATASSGCIVLTDHLISPKIHTHPRALSRLSARYIAVDFNDSLLCQSQLLFFNDVCNRSKNKTVKLHSRGRRDDWLSKYVDHLTEVHCSQAVCPGFYLATERATTSYGLQKLLCKEHEVDWETG